MMKARTLSEYKVINSDAARTSQQVIWDAAGTPAKGFINWPVAMYFLRGKWYIYLYGSPKNPPDFSDRLYVLEADTDDPMGTWTLKPRIGPDRWVIGYSAFEWQGRLYMVVSTREGHTSGTHHALAIAEMSNPWTIIGDWKTLTDPQYTWEKWGPDGSGKAPINEVDQAIAHNGKLHLFYSASHVASPNYAAGLLTYDGTGSLTDRSNWIKRPTPILSRTSLTAGPGQTFVFKTPDGQKSYLGYAYWNTPTNLSPRPVAIRPILWDANDMPIVNPPPDPGSMFDEPILPVVDPPL
jgi:GH43 family beta-xylosidase